MYKRQVLDYRLGLSFDRLPFAWTDYGRGDAFGWKYGIVVSPSFRYHFHRTLGSWYHPDDAFRVAGDSTLSEDLEGSSTTEYIRSSVIGEVSSCVFGCVVYD